MTDVCLEAIAKALGCDPNPGRMIDEIQKSLAVAENAVRRIVELQKRVSSIEAENDQLRQMGSILSGELSKAIGVEKSIVLRDAWCDASEHCRDRSVQAEASSAIG